MNKKRFAAIVLTALVFVGLLFGQGPVQKVRLWDTNLSHSLLLNWNEDRTAGYTLNWIGITADRTITLQGNPTLDNWFDQSVKTTFSPTFVTVKLSALTDGYVPYHVSDATGLANSVIRTDGTLVGVGMLPTVAQLEVNTSQIITSTTAAPYLKIENKSDTARDPAIQWAVGATPVTKFTMGVDDSDNDKFKISQDGALGTTDRFVISYGASPWIGFFTASPQAPIHYTTPVPATVPDVILEETGSGKALQLCLRNLGRDWWVSSDNESDEFTIADYTFSPVGYGKHRMVIKGNGGPVIFPLSSTKVFINDTSNAKMTCGLTIHGGLDDENLALKSTFNHGMTSLAETDTYGTFMPVNIYDGGLRITAYVETDVALALDANYTTSNTTKSSAGLAPIAFYPAKKSGTTVGAVGADDNLVAIRPNVGGGLFSTVWIADEDGDTWQSGTVTAIQGIFNIAIGTAPLTITSTTVVPNLNVDLVDGYHHDQSLLATDGPSFDHLHLTVAIGTAPLVVTSTTVVPNLNVSQLEGHAASYFEPALGNPDADGKVLSSTILGVRSWILPGGALTLDDLTDVDAAAPSDDDIIRFDTASGLWKHEALPAAANHNLLSATHSDTTAAAPVAGDILYADATPKWTKLPKGDDDDVLTLKAGIPSWEVGGGAAAPANAQYVTLAVDGTLSAERVLTAGTGIKLTDGGAGSTITTAADPDVVQRQDWIHEHFDGLNTATIIGQGSYNEAGAWIDDGMAAGSTAEVTVKAGGDKMLTIINNAAAGATSSYISSMITTRTFLNGGGHVHVKAKVNQDGSGYGGRFFTIMDGAGGVGNQVFSIYFRYSTTFQLAFWNGTGYKIQDCSKDTWYTIDAFWGPAGTAGGQVTIFIDGAFAYKGVTAASLTRWDRISISSYSPAGGNDCTLDVDDLMVYSTMPLGISY